MNPELLEKVLSCKKLPTLPAIAMKVIELTQDERVPVKQIGETIANDQGLSVKVLKTVNSPFYGLRKPCTSINQAIVMLGMSAVKTLALGFSLVGSLAKDKAEGFDYESYWRRSLLTGVAAKVFASETRSGGDEEAFLGGLLQDVGMIAMYQALGSEYGALLIQAGPDHRKVARLEMQAYEASHADVGAILAQRWRLPEALIAPVKFHERANAAPLEHLTVCNLVAIGNICADLLTAGEPAIPLKRLYDKSSELMGLSPGQVDAILKLVSNGAREVATLLAVSTGKLPNFDDTMKQARNQLKQMALPFHGGSGLPGFESAETETVTGLPSDLVFKRNLIVGFEQATMNNGTLSVALLGIEALAELRDAHGPQGGDGVVRAIVERVNPIIERAGGMLFVTGEARDGRLGAILPKHDRASATKCINEARRMVLDAPIKLHLPGLVPFDLAVGISAGVVCLDDSTRGIFSEPGDLLVMTSNALAAATRAGAAGNAATGAVRVHAPSKAA